MGRCTERNPTDLFTKAKYYPVLKKFHRSSAKINSTQLRLFGNFFYVRYYKRDADAPISVKSSFSHCVTKLFISGPMLASGFRNLDGIHDVYFNNAASDQKYHPALEIFKKETLASPERRSLPN